VVREGIDTGLSTPFDFPAYFALRDALSHHDESAAGRADHDGMATLETCCARTGSIHTLSGS